MTEIFNRAAFQAETPEAFQAEIARIWGMFSERPAVASERPAVASEWARFVAMKFSEVAA